MRWRKQFEPDAQWSDDDAFTIKGWGSGIAWRALGWEVEPDEDTEWTGIAIRTGSVVVVMIGDDRCFSVEPDDLSRIEREAYCGSCGQIGCTHDGLDRSEET